MNKSPLNYIITFAIGCFFWIISTIVISDYLSETIALASLPIEDFIFWYRIGVTSAGILSLLTIYNWFRYGSKTQTALNLKEAKRVWTISFFLQVSLATGFLMGKVVIFSKEGIALLDYIIIFLVLSLQTYIFYWLCTFFFSPRSVMYVVPPRR